MHNPASQSIDRSINQSKEHKSITRSTNRIKSIQNGVFEIIQDVSIHGCNGIFLLLSMISTHLLLVDSSFDTGI